MKEETGFHESADPCLHKQWKWDLAVSKNSPAREKITKPKQEKMELFWMTPVGLDSSLEACSGLGEEGNKSDFDGC